MTNMCILICLSKVCAKGKICQKLNWFAITMRSSYSEQVWSAAFEPKGPDNLLSSSLLLL